MDVPFGSCISLCVAIINQLEVAHRNKGDCKRLKDLVASIHQYLQQVQTQQLTKAGRETLERLLETLAKCEKDVRRFVAASEVVAVMMARQLRERFMVHRTQLMNVFTVMSSGEVLCRSLGDPLHVRQQADKALGDFLAEEERIYGGLEDTVAQEQTRRARGISSDTTGEALQQQLLQQLQQVVGLDSMTAAELNAELEALQVAAKGGQDEGMCKPLGSKTEEFLVAQVCEALKREAARREGPPHGFTCPICLELLTDPVILAETHHTFDRRCVEKWLQFHNTCPVSRVCLTEEIKLIPNVNLRQAIEAWKEQAAKAGSTAGAGSSGAGASSSGTGAGSRSGTGAGSSSAGIGSSGTGAGSSSAGIGSSGTGAGSSRPDAVSSSQGASSSRAHHGSSSGAGSSSVGGDQSFFPASPAAAADPAPSQVQPEPTSAAVFDTSDSSSAPLVPGLYKFKLSIKELTVASCAITPADSVLGANRLVTGSGSGGVKVWDLDLGTCTNISNSLEGRYTGNMSCMTPDGRMLVSIVVGGVSDCETLLWRLSCCCWSEVRAVKSSIIVYDVGSETCTEKQWLNWAPVSCRAHKHTIEDCAITPDGCTLVSGSCDNTFVVWDVSSGRAIKRLKATMGMYYPPRLTCCAITPNACTVVSGYDDGTLRVWDLASGSCMHTLSDKQRHKSSVCCCAITANGRTVVAGYDDSTSSLRVHLYTLRVWDVSSGTCTQTLKGHKGRVTCCAISPDGRMLVAAAQDLDGRTLVSGGHDNILKVWSAS